MGTSPWWNVLVFYAYPSPRPGTKAYYAWEIGHPHRGIVRDAPATSPWWNVLTFYAFDSCSISKVRGEWEGRFTIQGQYSFKAAVGTQRSDSSSTTKAYTDSVTLGLKTGASVEWGTGTYSAEVSAEYRHEWSTSYTTAITTVRSTATEFTANFGHRDSQYGKYLWQFKFTSTDSCGSASTTLAREYAFTSTKAEKPCCFPGHCTDAKFSSCDWCSPGFTVPTMKGVPRCKEGSPGTF